MKVGDLVTLSARAKKLGKFDWIVEDDVGLITEIVGPRYITSYKVLWNQSGKDTRGMVHIALWGDRFYRRELKFAKNMRQ